MSGAVDAVNVVEQPLRLEVLDTFRLTARNGVAATVQLLSGDLKVGVLLSSEATSRCRLLAGVEMGLHTMSGKESFVRDQYRRGIRGILLKPLTGELDLRVGEHLVAEPGKASPQV